MCRRDQSGTLGDGRCGSLAELCDWWNIHSCCWSNVKQQPGWLHSNIFLSPWQQNVTKWLSDKMQLISAHKNIPSWCKTKPVISTIIKKSISLKKRTGSLLVFPWLLCCIWGKVGWHYGTTEKGQQEDCRSEWLASLIFSNHDCGNVKGRRTLWTETERTDPLVAPLSNSF